MKRSIWLVLLLFIVVGRTLAQVDCPAIVQAALDITADACVNVGRNQACYGNVTLEAQPQAGAAFTFKQTGDIVKLSDVASLRLSAMDTDKDSWGIALLRTQANLPDTLPGQNVAFVLFGEVEMTDATPPSPDAAPEATPIVFQITANKTTNVRGDPSRGGTVVMSLTAGSTVAADGRTEDGKWLHVQLEDGRTGWVLTQLMTVDGESNQLPLRDSTIVEPTDEVTYGPMQAFYFSTGIGDSKCAQAPNSGILIQTPEGARTVSLLVNEVAITLGSTAYVQAGAGEMTITVIEGEGTVSAFGTTLTVPAGSRARIPLDANGAASGAPVGPEPYDATTLTALPIVLLPQQVVIATPLTPDQITSSQPLYLGTWLFRASTDCSLIKGEVSFTLDYLQPPSEVPVWAEIPEVASADDLYMPYLFAGQATRYMNDLLQHDQLTLPGHFARDRANPTLEIDILSPTSITAKVPVTISGGFCIGTLILSAVKSTEDVQTTESNTLFIGNWNMTATFACGILGSGQPIIPFEHRDDYWWDTPLEAIQAQLGVLYPLPGAFTGALYDLERNHQLTIPGHYTLPSDNISLEINVLSATNITGTLDYPAAECVMDVVLEANQ